MKDKTPKSEHQICTVMETAQILGVSQDFLRKNAIKLGGVRLGKRGHWRFIPAEVKRRMFEQDPRTDSEKRIDEWFKTPQV